MKKLISLLAFGLLTACSSESEPLDARIYQLQDAPNGAEITISFNTAENQYAGKAAVNRYFGQYEQTKKSLKLLAGGATMMMGPPELMQAEQEFLSLLPTINGFSVQEDILILKTTTGKELVFKGIQTPEE